MEEHFIDGRQLMTDFLHRLDDDSSVLVETFTDAMTAGIDGYRPGSHIFGDINCDGLSDLVVAQPIPNAGATIHIWLDSGDGLAMPRAADFAVMAPNSWAHVFDVGDLDGDECSDLVLTGGPVEHPDVGLVFGKPEIGSAAFTEAGLDAQASGMSSGGVVPTAGDLTGDGSDDLLLVSMSPPALPEPVPETCDVDALYEPVGTLAVFSGPDIEHGELSYAHAQSILCVPRHYFTGKSSGMVATGDLDGDGSQDIVFADENAHHTGLFDGAAEEVRGLVRAIPGDGGVWGQENLNRSRFLISPTGAKQPGFGRNIAVGDLDGDGFEDVLVRGSGESVPATTARYYCGTCTEVGMTVLHLLYLGGADFFAGDGSRFPDYVIVGGEHNDDTFDGVELNSSTYFTSLSITDDVDGDGTRDWVEHTSSEVNGDGEEQGTTTRENVVNLFANQLQQAHQP